MKIIKRGYIDCRCLDRLMELERSERQCGQPLHLGAEVECKCGTTYRLEDDQREGSYWHRVSAGTP